MNKQQRRTAEREIEESRRRDARNVRWWKLIEDAVGHPIELSPYSAPRLADAFETIANDLQGK